MRLAGHVARMGGKRNVYRLLVGKPLGKRPLGRPRHRWIDNIKMEDINTETWSCSLVVRGEADDLAKSKEVKIGWSYLRCVWQNCLQKALAQKV
jgi:hypothetical protein